MVALSNPAESGYRLDPFIFHFIGSCHSGCMINLSLPVWGRRIGPLTRSSKKLRHPPIQFNSSHSMDLVRERSRRGEQAALKELIKRKDSLQSEDYALLAARADEDSPAYSFVRTRAASGDAAALEGLTQTLKRTECAPFSSKAQQIRSFCLETLKGAASHLDVEHLKAVKRFATNSNLLGSCQSQAQSVLRKVAKKSGKKRGVNNLLRRLPFECLQGVLRPLLQQPCRSDRTNRKQNLPLGIREFLGR
jgi:hypothetical protein